MIPTDGSVTSIGNYAFYDCDSLTSVVIPDSVTSIGNYAFYNCSSLTDVYYTGSEAEWQVIDIDHVYDGNSCLTNAARYYYSETAPTTEGNFWHYVDGVPTVWPEYVAPAYSEGLEYTPNGDGTCYVSGIGTCTDLDIVIPETHDGMTVTGIGSSAFFGCNSLISVEMPGSVIVLGGAAFRNCINLTLVKIGGRVASIGCSAFQGCSGLTSVVIPDSVTDIGEGAFYDCYNLTSVVIGDSVMRIDATAFYGCSSLTSVVIGDRVTSIDIYAFDACNAALYTEYEYGWYVGSGDNPYAVLIRVTGKDLSSHIIHEDTRIIAYGAFSDCVGLTSITIPNGVTSIGASAFSGCSSLTSVVIPDSVTSIGGSAFDGCNAALYTEYEYGRYVGSGDNLYFVLVEVTDKNMSSYIIHENTKIIASNTFRSCSYLTSITIPSVMTNVGSVTFRDCTSLTSVVIPDSVTSIGDFAFDACTSLTDIYYTGSEEEWQVIVINNVYGGNDYLLNATIHYNYIPEE